MHIKIKRWNFISDENFAAITQMHEKYLIFQLCSKYTLE